LVQFETEVLEIVQRTENVKSFRFKIKDNLDFKPGQFFFVTLKIGQGERTKHFSFSNSPTEKAYIEFTKRITESEYSKALERLKIGDWAKLKMPLGSFTFSGEYEKIAFLSGGIGITPIRSICKFATDKGLSTDIVLLYGNNKEEDIIFRQDLDQMASTNKNMRVVYTLTSPDIDKENWPGRTGYIDDRMIKEEIADYRERVFYLCGPPKMVETLVDILKNKLSLGEDKIKIENFVGY
jgi:ferredoxin-NADP reductase